MKPKTSIQNDGDALRYPRERVEHALHINDKLRDLANEFSRQKGSLFPGKMAGRISELETELNRIRASLDQALVEREELTAERDTARELCVDLEQRISFVTSKLEVAEETINQAAENYRLNLRLLEGAAGEPAADDG